MGVVVPADEQEGVERLDPPTQPSDFPMLLSPVVHDTVSLAWQRNIPMWRANTSSTAAVDLVHALAPDAIVVACWPTRLPVDLLEAPRLGTLNIHPSLLPAYRGPAPLFWQLRDGRREGGVTIHRMSERLDEGPILGQAPLAFPVGATGPELDVLAARAGSELLDTLLDRLHEGTLKPRPQSEERAAYQGWPTDRDFIVPPSWSAERAWNFMRATEEWNIPFLIPLPANPLLVEGAVRYEPGGRMAAPVEVRSDGWAVRFNPGILVVSPSPVAWR